MDKELIILMATYNGEKYIEEQLESILNQTFNDYVIYICDDKSTDLTYEILEKYQLKYPDKIYIKQNKENTGSPKYNFFKLMMDRKAKYIMLCDQDDVWLNNKIEISLKKIKDMESIYGNKCPCLVHTDLIVTDGSLDIISSSFRKSMKADYSKTELKKIIVQNTLTGCTAIYNEALSELIYTEPKYMVMHDWYLMIMASAFGKIDYIDEKPILYRQHMTNEIGMKEVESIFGKLKVLIYGNIRASLAKTYRQAESFLEVYSDKLTEGQRRLLNEYTEIPRKSKLIRCYKILKLGTLKTGLSRIIAHILFV